MCGRYTLSLSVDELWEEFDLEGEPPAGEPRLAPRFNIAPTQDVPVIAARAPGRLRLFRWGLVPSWAQDLSRGARMINARAETAAQKPAFRSAFANRRCLVPATGFYEWRREPGGSKTPIYLRLRSGRPFAFAGLWESWQPPQGGKSVRSCTLLTVPSAGPVSQIHPRMPVILTRETRAEWLDEGRSSASLSHLFGAFDAALIDAREVSRRVNSPRNDGPECVAPVGVHAAGCSG